MMYRSLSACFCYKFDNIQTMTLGEISAVEQIMRMAVTGQQHVDALIGYYRSQIDNYNNERAQWALHYEQLKDSASNKHSLQRQLDNSKDTVNYFQGELNTIKANLAKERQLYYDAIQQNQKIKDKCQENRQKYREMVAVCKPITFGKSRGESRISAQSSKLSQPSEPKTYLQLELINISKDHESQKAAITEQIDVLKQQLEDLLSEHSQRGQACSKEYRNALENLANVEGKIMHLTGEYFKLRMENHQDERQLQEQNQILRLKAVALAKKLQLLRHTHSTELTTVDKEVKQRNKNFQSKYDQELKHKEDHLTILKEQHARINDIYILKLTKLEQQLRSTTERQKQVQEKYKSEKHSLRGQIKVLRNRLEKEGVREMRAQLADDDASEESSETLSMEEIQKLSREVQNLKKQV